MSKVMPGGSGSSRTGGGAFSAHSLCCYDAPELTNFSVGTSIVRGVADQDPDRIYLAFINAAPTNLITVNFKDSFNVAQGYQIPNITYPLEFNREDHGPIVTLQWNAIANAAASGLTVVTVSSHCHDDERQCNKLPASALYERLKPNIPLNPDYGFITSLGQSPSRWLETIRSSLQPDNNSNRGKSGRLRLRIHDISWDGRPRSLRNIRLNYQG